MMNNSNSFLSVEDIEYLETLKNEGTENSQVSQMTGLSVGQDQLFIVFKQIKQILDSCKSVQMDDIAIRLGQFSKPDIVQLFVQVLQEMVRINNIKQIQQNVIHTKIKQKIETIEQNIDHYKTQNQVLTQQLKQSNQQNRQSLNNNNRNCVQNIEIEKKVDKNPMLEKENDLQMDGIEIELRVYTNNCDNQEINEMQKKLSRFEMQNQKQQKVIAHQKCMLQQRPKPQQTSSCTQTEPNNPQLWIYKNKCLQQIDQLQQKVQQTQLQNMLLDTNYYQQQIEELIQQLAVDVSNILENDYDNNYVENENQKLKEQIEQQKRVNQFMKQQISEDSCYDKQKKKNNEYLQMLIMQAITIEQVIQ